MPLSCGTNAGCDSFAASSKFLNCDGAKGSVTLRVLTSVAPDTVTEKSFASLGFWLPTLSSTRSSGIVRWLTCSVPAGCRTIADSAGSSCRSVTSNRAFDGSCAFQFVFFPSSPVSSGMTATGGGVVFGVSPPVKSNPMSIEKKKNDSDAVPWTCHGVGPSRLTSMPTPYTPTPNTLTENCVEISAMKWNGENWISASKPELPCTEHAEKPKKKLECAPNCT